VLGLVAAAVLLGRIEPLRDGHPSSSSSKGSRGSAGGLAGLGWVAAAWAARDGVHLLFQGVETGLQVSRGGPPR
jgi:hypothetical protein